MKTSARGRAFIKKEEGFRSKAYQCEAHVWTIGYGFTRGVKPGDTITREEADARLITELGEYEYVVERATGGNCSQNEFDAMVSLCFNIGAGWSGTTKPKGAKDGFRQSSVLKAHIRGDHLAAARAFALWNKADGKVSEGLTGRRAREAGVYLEPDHDEVTEPADGPVVHMPQVVEPERPMAQSTINRSAVIAGGTATVATVTEVVKGVGELKDGIDGLGTWLVPVLLVVAIAACGYIIWERVKQRHGGWA